MQLHILAKPGRVKENLDWDGTVLTVRLAAPAQEGKANQRLTEVLATFFDLPKTAIVLVRGGSSAHKVVDIPLTQAQVSQQLTTLAPPKEPEDDLDLLTLL
jgi:uncharacterized protein